MSLPSLQSPAELLLDRLDRVRRVRSDSWVACCPAHADRSPSLSIRETRDGTLLLKCFAGCSVEAITHAVGLEVADLFPRNFKADYGPRQKVRGSLLPYRQAIRLLRHHLLVVQIAAARLAAGDELSEQDLDAMGRAALHLYEMLEDSARE